MSRASKKSVAISGTGESGCVREDSRSIPEMVLCAVQGALDDAGATYADIDAVVTSSVDLFDGLTASSIAVTEVVGAVMRPETRIAGDGLAALVHGCCQIWAGAYETVLVTAHGKASMSSHVELTNWAMDPVALQPLGANFLMCSALEADSMRAADASAEARWSKTASMRRCQAGVNGIAGPCSAKDVAMSSSIASPLREGMRAPLGDGAYAVLLTSADSPRVKTRITGVGHDLSPQGFWPDAAVEWAGLTRAWNRASAMSGLSAKDIDLFEPSCHFAHEEELFIRACNVPEGAKISPTGGLFGGVAPPAGGLSRLIAAAQLLDGDSGLHRALAHGTWGSAGQGQVVTVLEAAA